MTHEEKQIPSSIMVQHVIWAKAVYIIDKAAEEEVAALNIEVQHIQMDTVTEWVATVAGLTKQVQRGKMEVVTYSIIIFQALPMAVLQKKFSINAGKDF